MRQRRLWHGADDSGDSRHIVGQRLVDHHVAGVGTLVRLQAPQQAVAFRGVQRLEVRLAVDIFVEHQVRSECHTRLQLRLDLRKLPVDDPQGQVVVQHRHAGRQQSVHAIPQPNGRPPLDCVAVHPTAAVRGNQIRVIDDRAPDGCVAKLAQQGVILKPLRVLEEHTGPVGADVGNDKLQVSEAAVANIGKSLVCLVIGNDREAVGESLIVGGIHRVHARRAGELGDVADAVTVDVGGIGDAVLLHPVALHGQRRHVLGERRCAVLAMDHLDRVPDRLPVQIVACVEDEIVSRRGLDHDRHGPHSDLRGCGWVVRARTRLCERMSTACRGPPAARGRPAGTGGPRLKSAPG